MFRRILLWFGGLLVFSLAAFIMTSLWLSPGPKRRQEMMRGLGRYQSEQVLRAYQGGGAAAAGEAIARLDRDFHVRHHLVDASGHDLVTGEDRSAQLRQRHRPGFRLLPPKHFVIHRPIEGSKYILLIEVEGAGDPWSDLLVYGWIVLVTVLLCYWLAWTLARPIRKLREVVVRFGRGDLESRARFKRKDEIGELAGAFDQMAERIQTLLTAERRLLQDVSHELRSPLARLRFAVELARNSDDRQAAFARVQKEIDRLAALVGELLQVTRAEGDPEARTVSPMELKSLLEALVEDCRIESEARQCTIRLAAEKEIHWQGDKELLHRALENVVRNAIRHSPEGTSVEVELTEAADRVVVRVRDHGPGVPEQHLGDIFRPFFRVEEDRSRNGEGGVGLGLAIAERAVRVHHGDIRASLAEPGLCVEISLPK